MEESQPLARRSFFRANAARFLWNEPGTAVLALATADVDKTNQSYYGESSLHFLRVDGAPATPADRGAAFAACLRACLGPVGAKQPSGGTCRHREGCARGRQAPTDARGGWGSAGSVEGAVPLSKEGPVHDVQWSPTGKEFYAVYGFMPAKATLFK